MFPDVVCPLERQPLATSGATLVCTQGHEWPVDGGIPRMARRQSYADAFGLQWNTFRKTQLDSYIGRDISLQRARRCIGPAAWSYLHEHPGTQVLEVGCGAGRFTEVLLATGARVTSVDLSSAVEANQENFPPTDRHRVLQADVLRLPFAPHQYDMVFCLGVIQHTPNSEQTIAALFEQVRPGGWLVIDHYAHDLSWYTKTAPLVRRIMRRLPPQRTIKWAERLVDIFFPLHRAVRGSRIGQALVSRVSPVITYFHYYDLPDHLYRQWAVLSTHDSLTDWYKNRRTKGQIRRALEKLGAMEIACEYGGNGVEARCRRLPVERHGCLDD